MRRWPLEYPGNGEDRGNSRINADGRYRRCTWWASADGTLVRLFHWSIRSIATSPRGPPRCEICSQRRSVRYSVTCGLTRRDAAVWSWSSSGPCQLYADAASMGGSSSKTSEAGNEPGNRVRGNRRADTMPSGQTAPCTYAEFDRSCRRLSRGSHLLIRETRRVALVPAVYRVRSACEIARLNVTSAYTYAILHQTIRFTRSVGNVRLAYAESGAGPPLVKAANWLSHLEFDWQSPVWRHWFGFLSSAHRLIRYDARGCGLSDWDVADLTLAAQVADLEAVVETAHVDRFALVGISQGGAVAVEYSIRHPERVSHLVLYGAFPRGALRRGEQSARQFRALNELVRSGWGQENPAFRRLFATMFVPDASEEQVRWFSDLMRITSEPEIAARIFEAAARHRHRRPTCIRYGSHAGHSQPGRRARSLCDGARIRDRNTRRAVSSRWRATTTSCSSLSPPGRAFARRSTSSSGKPLPEGE